MVTVSWQAAATHNSYGHRIEIVEADEVELEEDGDSVEVGELTPDIEAGGPLDIDFHENLKGEEDADLPARSAPDDQTGQRYHGASCQEWSTFEGTSNAMSDYEAALRDGTGCYVGFIDQQFEYTFLTTLLLVEQDDELLDPSGGVFGLTGLGLYPLNPKQDDSYCRGEEDTGDRGFDAPDSSPDSIENSTEDTVNSPIVGNDSAVDTTLTQGFRATTDDCDGDGEDTHYVPGKLEIDANLIEEPVTAAHNTTGTPSGSGTWTLGQAGDTYTYIFGQPHPDTPPENRSGFEAGQGPFGPDVTNFGGPVQDITGACGDRTKDCALLSPRDIINYDTNFPREPDAARVCLFLPQYSFAPAGGTGQANRGQAKCGNWGERQDTYVGVFTAGGFGVTDAPTFVHTLPGWSWGVIHLQIESYDGYVGLANTTGFANDYLDDEKGFRKGWMVYTTVNPKVPDRQADLRCVTPNFLTDGDDTVLPDGFSDPGVYGTYQADAIDADIYPVTFRKQFADTRDATHDPVRNGAGPVPGLAAVQDATSGNLTGPLPNVVPQIQGSEADYTESNDPEPHAEYNPGDYTDSDNDGIKDSVATDATNQEPFANRRKAGLSCNAAGILEFNRQDAFQGAGMRFDVDVDRQAWTEPISASIPIFSLSIDANLKDPTLGVVRENESDAGAWQPDVYSFGGQAHAVLDINNNSQLDACPGSNLDPGEDVCPWEPLWDAYNSNCDNNDNTICPKLLDQKGYDRSQGVGLVFNLTVTGPTVLVTEPTAEQDQVSDRTSVLGDEDTTAQNCVIGTSTGFAPKLAKLVGTQTGDTDDSFDKEDARAFCPDEIVDGNGEWVLVDDAFEDQSASTPGGFDAGVQWAKLVPTPAAVQESSGFGATDQLCTTGVWSVSDLDDDGTLGNTTETGDENGIADDTEEDPDSPGQENIVLRFDETTPADLSATVFDDSLSGLHTFSDCDRFDTTGEPQQ